MLPLLNCIDTVLYEFNNRNLIINTFNNIYLYRVVMGRRSKRFQKNPFVKSLTVNLSFIKS